MVVMSSPIPPRPESIALIGGHIVLDLVNTVSWRHDPARWRENLAEHDLLTWAQRPSGLDGSDFSILRTAIAENPSAAERVLHDVRELREHLYQHLAARIDQPDVQPQVERDSQLHRALVDAVTASNIAGIPARWNLEPRTASDLTRVLALHALDLLQTVASERLRRCDDDGCGWLFLDTTRNHSRRWCSSGDCGNRDRARRHYARTRTATR